MSDWRGDNSSGKPPKPSRREPAKHREKKVKPAKRAEGGWKRKGAGGPVPAAAGEPERSWQGGYAETAPVTAGTVSRWMAILCLSVLAVGLTGFFVWWVFYRGTPLPLYVVSVGDCVSPELVENPFGNEERNALPGVNKKNIRFEIDQTRGNDNSLSKMRSELPKADAGGPSRKFVVFYINSFAVERDEKLSLVPQSGQPWLPGSSPESETVEMGLMLGNIARSLANRTVGWVVLDLHRPPAGLSPGGSDLKWEKLTRAAWEGLDENLRNRLVVTVACADGQDNWLAPEYKSSFFGYFFKRGLAGGFREKGEWIEATTLGELQKELNERISSAVASRRYAKQTPVWLVPTGLPDSIQVVSETSAEDFQPTAPSGLDVRLEKVAELWGSLEQDYRNAWRCDPVGVSIAQSGLILTGQLATWGSEQSFQNSFESARQAVNRIQAPVRPPGISLVETGLHERFVMSDSRWGHPWLKLDELARSATLPDFWDGKAPAEGVPPTFGPEQALPATDRAPYYWKWLVNRSRSDDRVARIATFDPARLGRGLQFCSEGKDWLEIYLVDLLRREVDWNLDGASNAREDACALAISVFDRLQSIASDPVPELSWWIQPPLTGLESRFLMAFDKLLAGSFVESARELGQIDGDVRNLESQQVLLANALETRDMASRMIPDLISWNILHFQYCDEGEVAAIESRLKSLAGMLEQTGVLANRLAQDPQWPLETLIATTSGDLRTALQSQIGAYQAFVAKQTGADQEAKSHPRTYRNIWLALQSPLTSATDRRLLHSIADEYLKQGVGLSELGADESDNRPPHRELAKAASVLIAALKTPADRDMWEEIISGKMRFSVGDRISSQVGREPAAGDSIQNWRSRLLQNDLSVRLRCGPFADASTFRMSVNTGHWPWSVGWQRWRLDTANYRLLQTSRLAQAAWGSLDNGNLDFVGTGEDCYFWQLAAGYRPEDAISGVNPVERLVTHYRDQWLGQVNSGVDRVRLLSVEFGKKGEGIDSLADRHTTTVAVPNSTWNAIPEVSLTHLSQKLPIVLPSSESRLTIPVDLSQDQKILRGVTVDLSPWKDSGGRKPEGRISLRGNWRQSMVDWKMEARNRIVYDLPFKKEPFSDAIVTVNPPDTPPVINVLLLVDCSDSMDSMIPRPLEEGGGGGIQEDVGLFELIKERAISMVMGLDQLQFDGEADVRLGLMPFGLVQTTEGGIKYRKLAEQVYRTDLQPLSSRWKNDVVEAIQLLKPSGETPLYDSIRLACSTLQELQGRRQLVYVLSDGVNFTNKSGLSGTASSVKDKLKSIPDLKLSMFHFDYFENWIARERENQRKIQDADPAMAELKPEEKQTRLDDFEAAWRRLQATGISELTDMNQLNDQFSYHKYQPSEYNAMIKDLANSIPRLEIDVRTSTGFQSTDPDNRRFVIPAEYLPCDIVVTAQGDHFGTTTQHARALDGESLTMTYNPDVPELQFPDFMEKNGDFSPTDSGTSTGNTRFFTRRIPNNQGYLEFRFGFGNTPAGNKTFVNRPGFLLAEVDELGAGQESGRNYFLADHAFMHGEHFPIARTSELKMDLASAVTTLKVWYADTIPECVCRVKVGEEAGIEAIQTAIDSAIQSLGLKGTSVQVSANAKTVTCQVRYESEKNVDERLFVICPQASSSDRRYDLTNRLESHVFSLDGSPDAGAAEILLVTPARLNESLDGNLHHYESSK